jgi:hypothetical protein
MPELLETPPMARLDAADPGSRTALRRVARNRGRPLLMSRPQLLDRIRDLAGRPDGLFKVHHQDTGLYARARRQFGSWAAAVRAAGIDYGNAVEAARRRSLENRRTRRDSNGAR